MTDTTPIPGRSSGLLLHVTSLPSRYGIGDVGPAAYEWIDLLAGARQRWWQVLPLGPIGPGDSPYSSYSAMGANTLLISPDLLIKDELLAQNDLPHMGECVRGNDGKAGRRKRCLHEPGRCRSVHPVEGGDPGLAGC